MVRKYLDRRRLMLAALPLTALMAWWLLRPEAPAARPPAQSAASARKPAEGRGTTGGRRKTKVPELEAIELARLEAVGGGAAGRRDIFDFGPPPTLPPPPVTAPPVTEVAIIIPPAPVPTGPPLPPPLSVKYIGAMEDKKRGLKVAILMTDRQEILTGRPGDVVANRLKIVSIGLESVDVQDVGAQSVRRLPLKGN